MLDIERLSRLWIAWRRPKMAPHLAPTGVKSAAAFSILSVTGSATAVPGSGATTSLYPSYSGVPAGGRWLWIERATAMVAAGSESHRVPYGYYQGKLRQEQVLQDSPVPVSILRAAQFHEFAGQYLAKVPGPVVIVPRWRAQPVAAGEGGAALAQIAVGDPVAMSELAGPREEIMADMIRQVVRARGDRRLVVSVRVPGAAGKALAAGGGLSGRPGLRGTQTFTDWVTEQRARDTL